MERKFKGLKFALIFIFIFNFILVSCKNSEVDSDISDESNIKPKYQVIIKVKSTENIIFSKYDAKVFIDGVEQGTIKNGDVEEYTLELEENNHNLKIVNCEDEEIKGENDFYVSDSEKFQFLISNHSDRIEIEKENYEEENNNKSNSNASIDNIKKDQVNENKEKKKKSDKKQNPDNKTESVEKKEPVAKKVEEEKPNIDKEILTVKNCDDLKNLLLLKDEADPSIKVFAEKYRDRIIEFDGCITYVQNHITNSGKVYNTRYDVLIGGGDYDPDIIRGPWFKFDNVNRNDMGLTSEGISMGKNVRVKAKVGIFNEDNLLFFLDPISVDDR